MLAFSRRRIRASDFAGKHRAGAHVDVAAAVVADGLAGPGRVQGSDHIQAVFAPDRRPAPDEVLVAVQGFLGAPGS